jgi:hypothetical protein
MSSEWQKMYCVENHGIFVRGNSYLVKIINNYTCMVKNNGKIIYEDPRLFQLNKVRYIQDEEELDGFDSEYYWEDREEYNERR